MRLIITFLLFITIIYADDKLYIRRDFLLVESNVPITNSPQNQYQPNQEQLIQDFKDYDQEPIRKEFNQYDLDRDGQISIEEIKQNFQAMTDEFVTEFISKGDQDMTGTVSFEEFFQFRTKDQAFDL